MKVNLEGDELSTRLYNRDNGENAAEHAISKAFKLQLQPD